VADGGGKAYGKITRQVTESNQQWGDEWAAQRGGPRRKAEQALVASPGRVVAGSAKS